MIFKLTGILFLIPVILLVIGAVVITGVVRGLLRMGRGGCGPAWYVEHRRRKPWDTRA